MRLHGPQVKRARKRLAESGHSIADVARLARVSWRMGKYWYDGAKSSPRMAAAHESLTGDGLMAREQSA